MSGCTQKTVQLSTELTLTDQATQSLDTAQVLMNLPLDNAVVRVTKKPFGIKISPSDSPISPEKFSGYHTGADFEILPTEIDQDIIVRAICNGPVIYKQYVSGYGGVLIQRCSLNQEIITVLYGHLQLSSIMAERQQTLLSSDIIGPLGQAYSTETDGERQHLHLSIHRGTDINLRGYVNDPKLLAEWIDPMTLLK
ncbi:MAG: hypothetical protein UT42_C0051G0014 [Candidatus Falkowbacteria bacterium GW2011_GWA2_39_24]|uniref:M23ase beta-sheet core domain-containing protein n=1 Tax=Candidatus Falkowbacteria bacterium GW2011_GWA2_39_24 TaxID=1618634 RepID=A0A0G0NAL5_9BACT|nr:MAG: hypothetical protein UT42_C0051G0014 [Candidatus Falkowbacteria bacterium GW2011_GWA2_39_24]